MVFQAARSYQGAVPFMLPCGRCIGCRIAKARDWATRMAHEATLHKENCFVTLTYEDSQLPADGSISKRAVQLWLKRLRKEVDPVRLRYFACGEYGDDGNRPHYHAILFGYAFRSDRYLWRTSPRGYPLYRSAQLESTWTFGNCELGDVAQQAAGYVARYNLKKVTGDRAKDFYRLPHPVTGVIYSVNPEFALMSTRPGIGGGWIDQFHRDAFPSDFVIIDGKKRNVPAYYKKRLTELEALQLKQTRLKALRKDAPNRTPERLAIREELQHLRQDTIKRNGT